MKVFLTTFLLFCRVSFSYGSDCPDYGWKPISYAIQIDTDIYKNESTFRGEVVINGVTTKETNTLVLHSGVNLTQVFCRIDGQSLKPLINQNDTVLTLTLNEILNLGRNFSLNFKYNVSKRPEKLNLSYNKQNGTLRPVFATDFEPSEARFVFPCLDIPKYKAYFDLKLARPEYMMALSNMPLQSTSEPDPQVGNQVWDTFHTSKHPMSTYLFAFVIFDRYEKISIDENKTIWHPENMPPSMFKLTVKVIPEIFKLFEDYTGIKYDFPKFDLFLAPKRQFPAMENWGLVFYNNEHFTSVYDSLTLVEFLTHEIGHQWFGNLVTCKYWCHSWINEGLDTYMTHLIMNKFLPSSKHMETLVEKKYTHRYEAMYADSDSPYVLTNSSQCCNEYDVPFGISIYSKGSLILNMVVSNLMDEVSFQKGIRQYLKHNAYGNVSGFELWNALEDQIDPKTLPGSLASVMEAWTLNSGFPVLNVYRFQNGSIALEQVSNPAGQFWWIPVTFTTSKTKDFDDLRTKVWVEPNSQKQFLDIKVDDDEWIIFNIQSSGYYEVNYDAKTWRLLVGNLLRSHKDIHPYNRADLVVMAHKFVDQSLSYVNLLDIFSYLKNEEEYLPFLYGLDILDGFLFQRLSKNYFEKVYAFYCDIMYERFRYVNSKSFQITDLSRRNYADIIINSDCSAVYDAEPKAILESTVKSILDNTNSFILVSPRKFWCKAMLSIDDQRIADFVKQKFIEEKYCDYSQYLGALCCAQKRTYIKKVLNDILFNSSTSKNIMCLLQSCQLYEENENCFIINFITENYDNITMQKDTFNETLLNVLGFQPYKCLQKFFKWSQENNITDYKIKDRLDENDILINNWFENRKFMIEENVINEKEDFVPNPGLYFKQSELDFFKIL